MAIPETQLEVWSHQGSVTQSSGTYQTIRNALLSPKAAYADKEFEVFLQGSYGNDTNIYAESDVDVVIKLKSIWLGDVSALPFDQQVAYRSAFSNATYTFSEFKGAVVTRLTTAFGASSIETGNKAIKIKANGSRRSADVVPCYEYRRYLQFSSDGQRYVSGVIFPTLYSGDIINFPKQHMEQCTQKHQTTYQWFKPMVRILKNMRSTLIADGVIGDGTAPSYGIENLLWSVPDAHFGGSYHDSFRNCITWLLNCNQSTLVCANGEYLLIGTGNCQWSAPNCSSFLQAVTTFWNGR